MRKAFSIAALPPDIGAQIRKDFPKDTLEVIAEIEAMMQRYDHWESERATRCVIYMANGNRRRLAECLRDALQDYRDPLFAAEYDGRKSGETPVRVRDFSKPFGQNEIQ
jgi:hypothetical protein